MFAQSDEVCGAFRDQYDRFGTLLDTVTTTDRLTYLPFYDGLPMFQVDGFDLLDDVAQMV